MAAAGDRGAVTRSAETPGQRNSWLGVVGIGLAALLLTAATVQWRQLALLEDAVRSADDYVVLQVYQAESEYLRLREQWQRSLDGQHTSDAEALQLRYEIWVSRVDLLHNGSTDKLLGDQPDFRATLKRIDAFVARADPLFNTPAGATPPHAALAALTPELVALGAPMHTLTLDVAHGVSNQMALRNLAVRQHNRIGIGLTLFLSGLTLAFALIALRQLRQLDKRRWRLEDLTADLRLARRDAEAASQAKSTFLANMSHEIRTPFHGLLGMLALLRETALTPRQLDHLRTAAESADHLLAILDDILDMSQLEAGRVTLTPVATDLRGLLRDVESLMRPQADAKALALHIDIDPTVPDRVMADPTRLRQVLFNLVSNAIKFTDRGAVSLMLRVGVEPGPQPGKPAPGDAARMLEFRVNDSGVGMDAAALAGLFSRFSPGDSSRSRRHGGTGLGLEISRTLARLMGGDIVVQSQPGVGSSFNFRAPLQPAAPAPPLAATHPADPQHAAQTLDVLVAEDHPVNRHYMDQLLTGMGHRAQFAANGLEAVQAARERPFDVILMDLHMPVLDGLAASRDIRNLADPRAATLPIIALTADAYPETRNRCLAAGMNDYLTKPVSPQSLATSLRRLFGATAAAPLPAPSASAFAPLAGSAAAALIDAATLDAALSGMPRTQLAALVHAYLDQGPQTVEQLRASVRDGQPLALREAAHKARGAALNLGLSALASTAAALQDGAAQLPAHEIARLVQRFEELLPASRQAAVAVGLPTPPAR